MDPRWVRQRDDCLGALCRRRFADPYRSADPCSLSLGHQALRQRALCRSQGLAGKQPAVEQHAEQLSRHPALPHSADAQIPVARRGRCRLKARSSPEIACANPLLPRRREEGVFEPMTHTRAPTRAAIAKRVKRSGDVSVWRCASRAFRAEIRRRREKLDIPTWAISPLAGGESYLLAHLSMSHFRLLRGLPGAATEPCWSLYLPTCELC